MILDGKDFRGAYHSKMSYAINIHQRVLPKKCMTHTMLLGNGARDIPTRRASFQGREGESASLRSLPFAPISVS